jgi:choline-glycine betaine transporter
VPSVVSLLWFAVFGGAGIDLQRAGADVAGQGSSEGQLFAVLEQYPLATATTVLVMVLVGIFFVSGADAASIVMGSLSQRGTLEPSRSVVIFWGTTMGAVAAIMLLISDEGEALTGLQNLTIIAALPFALVMAAMAVSLVKDLRSDPIVLRGTYASLAIEQAVVDGISRHGDDFVLVVQHAPRAEVRDEPAGTAAPPVVDARREDDPSATSVGGQGPRWPQESSSVAVHGDRAAHVTGRPQDPRN